MLIGEFDLFDECKKINSLFNENNDNKAREELINLLDFIQSNNIDLKEEPISNIQFFCHLIRKSGIYPYLEKYIETAIFEDKLAYSLFNLNINNEDIILHIEQSRVLKLLLKGENIVLSAPTSFGKSYIIDALISIKKSEMDNILIIVPTIALLDETRRRIYSKFKSDYNIITTSKQEIKSKNIFILTQERALSYIQNEVRFPLNLFIVDEFYKINDKDDYRSSILQRVVLYFKSISTQQYFLCPNIYDIKGIFIEDMKFEKLIDFKTVIHNEEYIENIDKENIALNEIKTIYYKNALYNRYPPNFKKLYKFLNKYIGKIKEQNLVYVYKVSNIAFISNILVSINKYYLKNETKHDIENFIKWVIDNYTKDWYLIDALKYGIGIHNGRIHRFLAQIQINLFNKKSLNTIIATSSIIEGVNTEIKNIFLWDMRENKKAINFFKYKNIVGRAGRMNKYFKSNAYRLTEKIFKPKDKDLKIDIEINTQTLFDYKDNLFSKYMTDNMKREIDNFQNEMIEKIGNSEFYKISNENLIKNDRKTVLEITNNLSNKKQNDINKLVEELKLFESEEWKNNYEVLYYILKQYSNIILSKLDVNFNKNSDNDKLINISKAIIFISYNWDKSISEIVNDLKSINLSMDDYFKIESFISFNLYSLFSDIDTIQKIILGDNKLNLSPFVIKLQSAFLPPHVYTLEEFGLPRMLSKTIDKYNIIKFGFNDNNVDINKTLERFKENKDKIKELFDKNSFDYYILKYFYDGISVDF